MDSDQFAERLAGVRQRFATRLEGRIGEVEALMPRLANGGAEGLAPLSEAHRRVHDLCGVGPTLGFPATGAAARVVERILVHPAREKRGLTAQEVAAVRQGLEALRAAAAIETKSI